jgi:hypothetical protein
MPSRPRPIELRCSWELAIALGAIEPASVQHQRQLLRDGRHLMMGEPINRPNDVLADCGWAIAEWSG